METKNGNETSEFKPDPDHKSKDHHAPVSDDAGKTPKKRRKVNHACVYCRRSHMTCDLAKTGLASSTAEEVESQPDRGRNSMDQGAAAMGPPSFDGSLGAGPSQAAKSSFDAAALARGNQMQLVQPTPAASIQGSALGGNMNQFSGFSDAWLTAQTHFHEMHNYHPNYMIAPEVSNEFNLLNDFLQSSLLDDGLLQDDQTQLPGSQSDVSPGFLGNANNSGGAGSLLNPASIQGAMLPPSAEQGKAISRPGSVLPVDKAREYYLQAADPSGNDAPEERMQRVLRAKYEAGLLKPFNYVKGYARLSSYLDTHVAASSKQKIIRQIDRFRPKFREKMQALSDMDLVIVEMWFEKTLIDYDRVFASMAVPACCWRRTGEIFRGNQEMAELINVPVERLRDGKISLHEILTEESVVRYWEEFGTIAFDAAHDTLLTACSLKNPDDKSNDPIVNCCFSFMIRKDDHKLDFARDLGSRLSSAPDSTETTDCLAQEIEKHISVLHGYHQKPGSLSSWAQELEQQGVPLWNLCNRLSRECPADSGRSKRLFLASRVFAFHLLAFSWQIECTETRNAIRLMKVALKAGRSCIEGSELDLSVLVLEKAADYCSLLKSDNDDPSMLDEIGNGRSLLMEYLILRAALAWRQNRLDIAEHMYHEAEPLLSSATAQCAERLSDVLYEIGKSLLADQNYPVAVRWLERANVAVHSQRLGLLSRDAIELRLAILQTLVAAQLGLDTKDSYETARSLVDYIEDELGNKPLVLLLRLDLLQHSPAEVFDCGSYADILRQMIKSFDLSESTLALRCNDRDLAAQCLEELGNCPDFNEYLAACIADSQHVGDIFIAISGLKKLVYQFEYQVPSSVSLPALLRSTIRLLYSLLNGTSCVDGDKSQNIRDVCNIFDAVTKAVERAPEDEKGKKLFTAEELEWFSRSAYNMGLKHVEDWDLRSIVRVLSASISIAGHIPPDISSQSTGDIPLKLMFSRFIIVSALVSLARAGDSVVDRMEDFLTLRKHVHEFDCLVQVKLGGLEDLSRRDMIQKLAMLLSFDFEAAVHLKEWDDLGAIVLKAIPCRNTRAFQFMADCLLRSDATGEVLYSTLGKIINELWVIEAFGPSRLAQYTRLLFQAMLPLRDELALRVIDNACLQAREASEVEWLATTAYNHSVDLYGAFDDDRAKEWAGRAISLAHCCQDGGVLQKLMKSKAIRMNLGVAEAGTLGQV
ncbi:SPO22-domain-containing protein [Thozetella sp. PMI_491]|nr:SPO22-domain-containing protein [Thozetella sp. PMI_491]